jgi:hypothetical protein
MTKDIDPDVIVREAEQAADEAESLVQALEDKIMAGDGSVTHEALSTQISLARFARKLVGGARAKAEGIRVANAEKARAELRSEILRDAPANGDHLLVLVDQLIATSSELVISAAAHDAQVRAWARRALDLGAPDKGLPSEAHAGLGVSAGGDVLVGDVRIQTVASSNVLGLLFSPGINSGIVPRTDEASLKLARQIVANIGKAAV